MRRPAGRRSEREEAGKRVEDREEGTRKRVEDRKEEMIDFRLRYQYREDFSLALTHFSYSQP